MKAFVAAVVFAVVAAVGMSFILNVYQRDNTSFTTDGARVSQPGDNLIKNG
jgi:hypothetical protein